MSGVSGVDLEQLNMDHFIGSVQEKGVLDRSINQLIEQRGPDKPILVIESIHAFISSTRAILDDAHLQMVYNIITFENAAVYLRKIEHNAVCVGAPRLRKVCRETIAACILRDQLMSSALFTCVRFEFATLVQALNIILEMENAIVARLIRQNQALRIAPRV